MKVKLNDVRLAFPDLFQARANEEGKQPKFGANFTMEPGSANAKALDAAVIAVAKEKWGAKAAPILEKLRAEGRVCYHTAPKTNGNGEVYDGFADKHWVSASNKVRPTILDRDKSPLTQADGKPYSGCYVNVVLDVWAQDNNFGKRINAELQGVQFLRDGDAFGGGAAASADDFDEIDAPETADDLA